MNKKLVLLCGPSGSGKSTLAKDYIAAGYIYVNQDLSGRKHLEIFDIAILAGVNVVVDRLNFVKHQRDRYLRPAKEQGYNTEIIVLHESYETCLKRCLDRKDHLTIKDERSARSALNMFFSKYERVQDNEADKVERRWPERDKLSTCTIDLDGTLCNVDHRLHYVKGPGKKNWHAFFEEMVNDTPNQWCLELVKQMSKNYQIVFCSGRPDTYRNHTIAWLMKNGIYPYMYKLYMRPRSDSRKDSITKEVILDFELLTKYKPLFFVDDRLQVTEMYRSRDFTVLQCAKGDF